MFTHNSAMYGTKIIVDLAKGIIYFPLWWYSRGLFNTAIYLKNFLIHKQKALGLLVWIKNIHKPMYGQSDWQGIIISIIIRLFQIIIRSIVMLFWLIIAFALLIVWAILPIFILYEIYFQLI